MDKHYLLDAYQRELQYLFRQGSAFAKRYPKIAARLELDSDGSRDPHVERLIEAFAFMAARLQHNIDDEYASVSSALQEVIYPQFRSPIPSTAIVQFAVDAQRCNEAEGYSIAKGTRLYAEIDDIECQFRTSYPVTLWPLTVANVSLDPVEKYDDITHDPQALSVLRIRLESEFQDLAELNLSSLRFYINTDLILASQVYRALFYSALQVAIVPQGEQHSLVLPAEEVIQPVGLEPDEEVLPCSNHAYSAYNLLTEFFCVKQKFMFFDITKLQHINSGNAFEVLVFLSTKPNDLQITPTSLALGCAPIINLFKKVTDPVTYRPTQSEFLLSPDKYNEHAYEIYAIEKIHGLTPDNETVLIPPLYSANHVDEAATEDSAWILRRDYSYRESLPGTECYIGFFNYDKKHLHANLSSFYADTWCTNRHVAERMIEGALLFVDQDTPTTQIRCIRRPTQQVQPPLSGEQQWQFISALSFHHLNLLNNPEGVAILRDILRTVSFSDSDSVLRNIMSIRDIETKTIVRRVSLDDAWKGFVKGVQITVTFDRAYLEGRNPFLFGAVLDRFFSQLVPINSFSELIIKEVSATGICKQWKPRSGSQVII